MRCMEWNPGHCMGKQALDPLLKSPASRHLWAFAQILSPFLSVPGVHLFPESLLAMYDRSISPVHSPGTISRCPALNRGPFAQRQHAVNFCCGWGFLTTLHKFSAWLPSPQRDLQRQQHGLRETFRPGSETNNMPGSLKRWIWDQVAKVGSLFIPTWGCEGFQHKSLKPGSLEGDREGGGKQDV